MDFFTDHQRRMAELRRRDLQLRQHFQNLAEESRTMSESMGDRGARETMLRVAADYDRMADGIARNWRPY